jgi:uncharacterized phosphosugar-binding protein
MAHSRLRRHRAPPSRATAPDARDRPGVVIDHSPQLLRETTTRLERLAALADSGGLDTAVDMITKALDAGGIVQAFGTGHSQAFAMEIAGRAGGLIPSNNVALRDVVFLGGRDPSILSGAASLERDPGIVDDLWSTIQPHPEDVFVIASNSGVNGSIVGIALAAKENGHGVIAVTSLEHTARVSPKHPSGKRLSEVADVVIDNLAPYGDTTLTLDGAIGVGAVSSMTAAFIAQLITIGVAERIAASGSVPPIYLSANIPGGDDHNHQLEGQYGDRLRRHA